MPSAFKIFRPQLAAMPACLLATTVGLCFASATANAGLTAADRDSPLDSAPPADARPSADNNTPENTTQSAPQDASPPQNGPAPMASRLVSDSELDTYLEQIVAALPMSSRATDPFGSVQDPDATPPPPPVDDLGPAVVSTPSIPFSDVIDRIKVTTVMPGEGRFLVGTRSFRTNDVFPVNYRGRTYQVQVESVSSSRIRFRNKENEDTADLELRILPAGMTAGGSQSSVPGLTRTGPDAPINLD